MFAPQQNGRKFGGRLHGWQNTENSAAASCKNVRSTEKEIIHTSSTAYEQDHSAAVHNPRARRPRAMRILRSELPLAIAKEFDASPWACPKSICGRRTHG